MSAFRKLSAILVFAGIAFFLSACSGFKIGNIDDVREASDLAVACKTNEALVAIDHAVQGGGLGGAIGDLQRVVILRDAGRIEEANEAMAERNRRWNVNAQDADEAEKAVNESVEVLRAERQKKVGRRTCD